MITNHAALLKQFHEYVDEYVGYLVERPEESLVDANAELRQLIRELETWRAHPDQQQKADHLSEEIHAQRSYLQEQPGRDAAASRPRQTLAQAFHDYIDSEIAYLARVGGATRRQQTNLLLGDIIADLKALALHPNDEQRQTRAADLEAKREQLRRIQRPSLQARDHAT